MLLFLLGALSLISFLAKNAKLFAKVNYVPETQVSMIWITTYGTRLLTNPNESNIESQFLTSVPIIGIKSVIVGRIINDQFAINKIELPSIGWFVFNRSFSVPVYHSTSQNELITIIAPSHSEWHRHLNDLNSPFIVSNGKADMIPNVTFYEIPQSHTELKRLTYQLAISSRDSLTYYDGLVELHSHDSYELGIDATYGDWFKELGYLILIFLIAVKINKKKAYHQIVC